MCLWDSKPATKLRSESLIYEPIAVGRMIEAVNAAIEGLKNLTYNADLPMYLKNYDLTDDTQLIRCLKEHTSEFKGIGDDVFTNDTFKDGFKTATKSPFPGLIKPPTLPPP